jgi:hypothetical protein
MNLEKNFVEIMIEGKKIEEIRTIGEMNVVEGKVDSFCLCPLGDFVLKQDSISVPMILRMKEYVERVSLSTLDRNITTEFLISMKKVMEKMKDNEEMLKSLKSLVFSISLRGAVEVGIGNRNHFFFLFIFSSLLLDMEKECKNVLDEKGEGKEKEKEKEEIVMSYVLLMKHRDISDDFCWE